MNGMCDLSAHLKSGFMCMTLGLWNPKGCNYVESIHEELWVLMKINEEVERTWFYGSSIRILTEEAERSLDLPARPSELYW